uniref:Endonuclease/exonuclease/phosphatase domain-containing protein n=1 Tax=Seriola dumerili TaxID=41447 RepID=A0A3B4V6J8_SERDU
QPAKTIHVSIGLIDIWRLNNPRESQKLTAKWINQAYHSVYNSKKRGTSILISKNIPFSHISTLADPEGSYIIVTGSIGKDTMTLANIYSPNTDSQSFFHSLFAALSKFPNSCVILGGDFNITLDSHMDRSSSTSTKKSNRPSTLLKQYMSDYGLIDIWRLNNPIQNPSQNPNNRPQTPLYGSQTKQHLHTLHNHNGQSHPRPLVLPPNPKLLDKCTR